MLADNIVYLKKNYIELYDALKRSEKKPSLLTTVVLEETKNNKKTLKLIDKDKSIYLHSKYDPIREAELIIDQLEEREKIDEDKHIIFYGIGLGYHVMSLLKRYPKIEFSLYEPSIDVLRYYLNEFSLNHLPLKQLITIQSENEDDGLDSFFNSIITMVNKESIICELPPYQKAYAVEYEWFLNKFRNAIKNKRGAIHTNYAFKKRWILNSVINLKEVLNTPNILIENNDVFKDKTAVLVSAGPSLDYEIQNLKNIKDNGLAYIFTVGSAINTLIHHEIYPDAMCAYDPTERSQLVFKKVNDMGITSIPMIFGSSVVFETLQNYQGHKYHMITSQDSISNYFLRDSNGLKIDQVTDAPSIAVVTLELLYKLGFKEIILVGQNLAYLDNKDYAEGIEYQKTIDAEKEKGIFYQDIQKVDKEKGTATTIDVFGNEVATSDGFINIKNAMEIYINNFNIAVINTTKGGAHIEGTVYMEMDQVLKEKLNVRVIDGDEFHSIISTEIYDLGYLKNQLIKMNNEYQNFQLLLTKIRQQLIKTDELILNKNRKQSSWMYQQVNQSIIELESNDFAKVFALPMNRVEHELLAMNIKRIQREKNELKKNGELIAYVNAFINQLYEDSRLNGQIMDILSKWVEIKMTNNIKG